MSSVNTKSTMLVIDEYKKFYEPHLHSDNPFTKAEARTATNSLFMISEIIEAFAAENTASGGQSDDG